MPNEEFKPDAVKDARQGQSPGFRTVIKHLGRSVSHNIGWKIMCVVLAVCLWGILITQDSTLLRQKQLTDATISVLNEDTLQRNGFIVVAGLEEDKLEGVTIKAEVPQAYYDQVTAANYNVRVDLSRIRTAGEQVLNVISTSTTTYGRVLDLSVKQLTVMVEEYVPRSRIPVRVETVGQAPDGFYASAATVDPSYIGIAGPRSLVESVARCVAQYDMSLLPAQTGTERVAVPFTLYDRQGNEVSKEDIDVTASDVSIDSVTVEQTLYRAVELPVTTAGLTTGTPKKGYEIKSIVVEPSKIRLAFADNDVISLTHIYPAGTIDVSGADSPLIASVALSRPSGTLNMSDDQIYVTVNIGPKTE